MTPQERRIWEQMERQARTLSPEIRAALFALYREAEGAISDAELLRRIQRGDVQGIVDLFVSALAIPSATAPFRDAIRTGYTRTARTYVRTLPLPRTATVQVAFDFLNPRVLEALKTLESRALASVSAEAAETIRQVVARGLVAGVGPRALIPELRASLGLAPSQEAAVANFRAKLLGGPRVAVSAEALDAKLRDRRFDAQLRRARRTGERLSEAQVERMTAAYRRKMLAFNAETHARTTALDATRAGQRAAWEAAFESGVADRGRITKRWVTTIDGRQRPEHDAMHGVTIPFDQRFAVDGGVLVPGENTYNCRCALIYRVTPLPVRIAA